VTTGYDEMPSSMAERTQRVQVSSTSATQADLSALAGHRDPYTVSVWIYAGDAQSACSLGVDPAGGTSATSGGIWSSATTNVVDQESWTGTPTANSLTVFLKVASTDSNPRNGCFDDAAPSLASVPNAKLLRNSLTRVGPQCPPTRLEQAVGLTSPPTWTPATNPVSVSVGRKILTITPALHSAFFRLALD
jgi:hypothetical protein